MFFKKKKLTNQLDSLRYTNLYIKQSKSGSSVKQGVSIRSSMSQALTSYMGKILRAVTEIPQSQHYREKEYEKELVRNLMDYRKSFESDNQLYTSQLEIQNINEIQTLIEEIILQPNDNTRSFIELKKMLKNQQIIFDFLMTEAQGKNISNP